MQHSGERVSHMRQSWLKVAVNVPGKLFHSHVIFNFVRSQGKERSCRCTCSLSAMDWVVQLTKCRSNKSCSLSRNVVMIFSCKASELGKAQMDRWTPSHRGEWWTEPASLDSRSQECQAAAYGVWHHPTVRVVRAAPWSAVERLAQEKWASAVVCEGDLHSEWIFCGRSWGFRCEGPTSWAFLGNLQFYPLMLWFCNSSCPSFRFLSCILSLASAVCARSGSWQRDPAGHGTQQRALREGERGTAAGQSTRGSSSR